MHTKNFMLYSNNGDASERHQPSGAIHAGLYAFPFSWNVNL